MNKIYKVNKKMKTEKGEILMTSRCNILLDKDMKMDIFQDDWEEYIDINKILCLPYKLGCTSNQYNKCNIYINKRSIVRDILSIEKDDKRGLAAIVMPDVYIIMNSKTYKFLEVDDTIIGKTYSEVLSKVINQDAMRLDLLSTKDGKLQINVTTIDESRYEQPELVSVFDMYEKRMNDYEVYKAKKEAERAKTELTVEITEDNDPFANDPLRPRKKKATGRRAGK